MIAGDRSTVDILSLQQSDEPARVDSQRGKAEGPEDETTLLFLLQTDVDARGAVSAFDTNSS